MKPAKQSVWYREPMMWLIIGLPLAIVIAGIGMLIVAIRSNGTDSFPVQVRRTAQIQVEDLASDRAAIAMDLKGHLYVDPETKAIRLELDNVPTEVMQVQLDMIHPAREMGDVHQKLVRSGDAFLGRLDVETLQVWSVQVRALDGAWRIYGRFEPGAESTYLQPALREAK